MTREKLHESLAKVLSVITAKEKHETIFGEAQDLTVRRNEVLEKLEDW